jgi:RNA polymerase sigma-70 factor (ECF subfamily)
MARAQTPADLYALADEDLMAYLSGGHAAAFEVVYARHEAAAFSLAYRVVGERATAEEVVQDAFMNVWRSGFRYDPARGSVRTWLLGIVQRRAIDALRRGGKHARRRASDEGIEEWLPADERTDRQAEIRDQAATVRAALLDLPEDQRRAVELAYYGGCSHSEIATLTAVPMGTVKGRLRLALKKLRGELAPLAGETA